MINRKVVYTVGAIFYQGLVLDYGVFFLYYLKAKGTTIVKRKVIYILVQLLSGGIFKVWWFSSSLFLTLYLV